MDYIVCVKIMKRYLDRCIESRLKIKLASSGAVWIKGPKWCGKSTTAERFPKAPFSCKIEKIESKILL